MAQLQDMTERIEQRVNQGLLGQWYAVCKSVQVQPGRPHAVKALGERLVLWRDDAGKLNCVEDYCPHRGAPLSRGEVKDGLLACRYHGVAIEGSGAIARVPAMPECPLEGRKAVRSYAVTEASDAVFIYVPSVAQPTPPPLNLPVAPRVIAVTPELELVGVRSGTERMTVFLHEFVRDQRADQGGSHDRLGGLRQRGGESRR